VIRGLAHPASGAAALIAIVSATSCHGGNAGAVPIVQPGAPGARSRVVDARAAADMSRVQFTPADVRFMQGMIGHHSQALEMTALARTHASSDAIRRLALRIELSQADEIKMMQEWLTQRGQALPDPHAHHGAGAVLMPGMLTAGEMARLGEAHGADFDRLFLESMIKHHEGALIMVRDLFAQPGAGQEADVFAFASDVDADQRMEIDRMRAVMAAAKEPVR
jgi:uncharacterized protein (DUF305 family)